MLWTRNAQACWIGDVSRFSAVISPAQLAELLDRPELRIVDCRASLQDPAAGREAHRLGHLPGASFPSGHAQAAATGYGILLLVFLPVLAPGWRRVAIGFAAFMVVAIAFSRVALAAHFVSDVVAGIILGAAWTAGMAALFSAWRVHRGHPEVQPTQGLAPEQATRLDPTKHDPEPTPSERE